MIINFSALKLSIIFLLVILFPLIQKQWLNLYLFDINNFTIYKLLYYLSGIIVPVLVIINSLNHFTYYKFTNKNINKDIYIKGKSLFFITLNILIILSILVCTSTYLNVTTFFNLFISDNKFPLPLEIDKQILFIIFTSILLLFKKTKVVLKKISLINFFIMSIIIWYLKISNVILNDEILINIFKFGNINFINVLFILSIETFYYIWSYVSDGTNLTDWRLPRPNLNEIKSILNIIIFYFLIIIYYSILF